MELINVKIYIGDSADTVLNNPIPTGISVFDPYIKWQLPSQIKQARFAIKITSANDPSLSLIFKSVSPKQQFQIPIGNGFNNKWIGVCFIQIQISTKINYTAGNQFEYTSGQQKDNPNGYFVIDTNMQSLSVGSNIQYLWQKSFDQNIDQSLIYNLQVATHPLFTLGSLVLNNTNIQDVQSGYISFDGTSLDQGIYFFRVRAYDGYDFSQWSFVNVFRVRRYSPPKLKNLQYTITNNQTGDIIIQFDTECQQQNFTSIILTFCPDDSLLLQYPCTLRQTSHIVPVGHNKLTWISAQDIKYDGGFFLYAFAYYNGSYSETSYLHIDLSNYKYSITHSTVSNINVDFILKYYASRKIRKVYYTYIGWNNNIYLHQNGSYWNPNAENSFLDNNVYFPLKTIIHVKSPACIYQGWNTQIPIPFIQRQDLSVYSPPKISNKYIFQNNPFIRFKVNGPKDFSLYADGRNFCRKDQQDYQISADKDSEGGGLDDISLDLGEGDSSKAKVTVHPPYQKAAAFDPIFKGKIPATSGETKQGLKISVSEKINWTYYLQDMDWTFYAQIQAKQGDQGAYRGGKENKLLKKVYLKTWGGQLGDAKNSDSNLKEIIETGLTQKIYQKYNEKAGGFTFPDGKLNFQDNQNAPQYTMYPNVYKSDGYPVSIDQRYWKCINMDNVYIKKYTIQKGGSTSGQNEYKDFSVQKKQNYFHRFFTDGIIPQRLILNKHKGKQFFTDQFGTVCYSLIENTYYKVQKKYTGLPLIIKFDSSKQNLVYTTYQFNSDGTTKQIQQKLYFQQYIRKKLKSRGKGISIKVDEKTGIPQMSKESPFSNIAVPYYVKASTAIASNNQFNGRSHVFGLSFKIKRDKRRYILGHYYKWGNRQKDQTRLQVLNNFIDQFYQGIDFTDIKFDNVILHFKYKYLTQQSVDEISQDNYVYAPVYTMINDQYICKRAWFKDNSQNTFKSVSKDKNHTWTSIDDDDYIYVYRDLTAANFHLTDGGFAKKQVVRNIKVQGTSLSFDAIHKQNYYSDKSQYGIQSYYVIGDLSQVIVQKFKQKTLNEYVSLDRIIYLQHKDVISDTVSVYYYNDNNEKKQQILDFTLKKSTSYYNAYIKLKQNQSYIDKIIYIQYRYIITTNYSINNVKSNIIRFSSYDQYLYFDTNTIQYNTFYLKDQDNNIVDKIYYNLSVQQNLTKLFLVPYCYNKNLVLFYYYKDKIQAPEITYNLNYLNKQNDKYVLQNLSNSILQDTIDIKCLDKSARDHKINLFEKKENSFQIIDASDISKSLYKPTILKYNYRLIKDESFNIIFSGFNTYLSNLTINVDTIKIYYQLDNGIQHNITQFFQFCSVTNRIINGTQQQVSQIVTTGRHSNILVQVRTTNQQELKEIFGNILYASYDGEYVQQLYLTLPSVIDSRFLQGFDYEIYCQNNVISSQKYMIHGNKIMLTTSSDYTQVVPYLNKDIKVLYRKYQNFSNYVSSFDFSTVITDINDSYYLPVKNILWLNAYYLNEFYGLTQIQENDFTINKANGQFKLTNSNFVNKTLFFTYQYKNYVYEDVSAPYVFSYIKELNNVKKDIVQQSVYAYVNSKTDTNYCDTVTKIATQTDFKVRLQKDYVNIVCLYQNQQISKFYYYIDESNQEYNQVVISKEYFNKTLTIRFNKKLDPNLYSIDFSKSTIKLLSSSLVGKQLVLCYSYLARTQYYEVYNNIITQDNKFLTITQQQIDNRVKRQDQTIENYQNIEIDLSDIDSWQIYYQYDLCQIKDYEFDKQNKKIIINKSIDTIDDYIKLNYCDLSQEVHSDSERIIFQNVYEKIALKHGYCYDSVLKLDNTIVNPLDYYISYEQQSYISLTNRYVDKQLFSQYDKAQLTKVDQYAVLTQNTIQLQYSDVFSDSVSMYYIDSQNKVLISRNYYDVTLLGDKWYIVIKPQYFTLYDGKNIILTYKYYQMIHDNTCKNIVDLKFESYSNVIYFNHPNTSQHFLMYKNNDEWITIPEDVYKYEEIQGENAKITMIQQASTVKYFRKQLMLNYSVQTDSEIQQINFLNDRSLVFKDENSYIVLQHPYINKSSFIIYYQDSVGIKIMPKQAYLLDTGSEQYNAVVVMNKKYQGIKNFINKRLKIQYQYILNPKKVYNKQNEKFPYLDFIFKSSGLNTLQYYYQGYPVDEHIGFRKRNQPTYFYGRGIKLTTNLKQPSQYIDLKFLYLQSVWDAYNTIHMDGTLDGSAQIVLQYGQVDKNGFINQQKFKDFITVSSVFNKQINYHLLPPLTWDVFVDTFDDSVFIQNQVYILRMRVYNTITNTFTSQWCYSGSFMIDHDAVNPVNITNIQYNPWTRRCKIQFRIDDTQGDLYDLIDFAYTSDGNTWKKISRSDIHGNIYYLTSNKKNANPVIYHSIFWDTSSYTLQASSSYRIKINANYTKYNQGDQAIFYWECSLNPLIDYYQSKIFELNGGKQYYLAVKQTFKKIENKDGTISYQQVQNPNFIWEKIQPYQYTFLDDDGNPMVDSNGKPITQTRDYIVVNGQLQDAQEKIKGIKGRPQKTYIQNGIQKTIDWGYLQYCDSNGAIVDKKGYKQWLKGIDTVYNQVRQILINNLQSEIDFCRQQIEYYKQKILSCQMENRRQLIRQGYYSNGFLDNVYDESDPTDFLFRLKNNPTTQTQSQWIKSRTNSGFYQVKYNFQLDFYDSYDSQYGCKPLRDFYNYYHNQSLIDITAGIDQDDADKSSLYHGNFTISNDRLPGKISSDTNIKAGSYTNSYFWRVRPYVQFNAPKKQIPISKIISITDNGKNIVIQFSLSAKEDLGILSTSSYYGQYQQNNYLIPYQRKLQEQEITLIQPYHNNEKPELHSLGDVNVYFQTDRLRDQDGYVLQRKSGYLNWISFTSNRQRPQVLIFQNDYYMFYDKKGINNNDLIYLSLSKDGTHFGQYSQTYPYQVQQDIQNYSRATCMKNAFVMRKNDSFYVWASSKIRQIDNELKDEIVYMQSDYYGDKFAQVIECSGLEDCDCPSVFTCRGTQRIEHIENDGYVTYTYQDKDYFIMLCIKNSKFKFFYSTDKIQWEECSSLQDKVQFHDTIKFDDITYNQLKMQQNEQEGQYRYLSPFLYKTQDNQYYLYYCRYDNFFQSFAIYRTKYNKQNQVWEHPQHILDGGFNPTVVQDYYYGKKYHRMYYNITKTTRLNGQDKKQIVICNCFITNDINVNEQFYTANINSITSDQRACSLNNILAGDYHKCQKCCGSGEIIISDTLTKVCNQCNGIGYVNQIIYKYTIQKSKLPQDWQNYNFYIRLYKKYNDKQYKLYSDWYNFENANQFGYRMTPKRKWNYLSV